MGLFPYIGSKVGIKLKSVFKIQVIIRYYICKCGQHPSFLGIKIKHLMFSIKLKKKNNSFKRWVICITFQMIQMMF